MGTHIPTSQLATIDSLISEWVTSRTVSRIIATVPRYWCSAVIDDHFGGLARMSMQQGIVLTDDVCRVLENRIGERGLAVRSIDGVVVNQAPQVYLASDTIDVLDPDHPHTVMCRRWMDQAIPDLHIQACQILSNTAFGIDWVQYDDIQTRRRDYPRKAKLGCTQEGYFPNKVRRAIAEVRGNYVHIASDGLVSDNVLLKTPIGNLDYRMRKYGWTMLNIMGNPRIRSIITCPTYEFTEQVRGIFEDKVLMAQFNLSPDDALGIANNQGYGFLRDGGSEATLRACRSYRDALVSGQCDYWGEFDAIGSGIINAWMQLGKDQAIKSGDFTHPDHIHPRTLFAVLLRKNVSAFANMDPTDTMLDAMLKLVLPALQYGAGQPGVLNSLTGRKWCEEEDVDWDLFNKVSPFLTMMFPFHDESHDEDEAKVAAEKFHAAVSDFAGVLASQYAVSFSEIKAAEVATADYFKAELEAGRVPEFTSFSGARMLGPVAKRLDATHDARVPEETELCTVTHNVACSNKRFGPDNMATAAFSWVLHNIDAEIISLFVVRAHAAGIPCFTNHDAVFIPLWAWEQAQRIFTECVVEVNRHRILVGQLAKVRSSGRTPEFLDDAVTLT